jgi:uncharacterized membrane protein YsdA (DUF1294 family)
VPLHAVDDEADALMRRNDLFQRQPPEFAEPIGKAGRHIERERNLVARQNRIGISIVYFGAYAADKSAAISGGGRISERDLLVLGLAGGWPGAIVAQQFCDTSRARLHFVRRSGPPLH